MQRGQDLNSALSYPKSTTFSCLHLPVNQALRGKWKIYTLSQSSVSGTFYKTGMSGLCRRGIPEAILKAGEAPGWRACYDNRSLWFTDGFWKAFGVKLKQNHRKWFTVYFSQVLMFPEKPAELFPWCILNSLPDSPSHTSSWPRAVFLIKGALFHDLYTSQTSLLWLLAVTTVTSGPAWGKSHRHWVWKLRQYSLHLQGKQMVHLQFKVNFFPS